MLLQLEVLESEEAAAVRLDGSWPEVVRILGILDIYVVNKKLRVKYKSNHFL